MAFTKNLLCQVFVIWTNVFLRANCSGSLYPPFYNVALNKRIYTEPEGATCGNGATSDRYCRSQSNRGSIDVCIEETCINFCAHTSQIETNRIIDVLANIDPNQNWSCVTQQPVTLGAEGSEVTMMGLHFRASPLDGTCGVIVRSDFTPYIAYIFPNEWNATYTFYVRHELNANEIG